MFQSDAIHSHRMTYAGRGVPSATHVPWLAPGWALTGPLSSAWPKAIHLPAPYAARRWASPTGNAQFPIQGQTDLHRSPSFRPGWVYWDIQELLRAELGHDFLLQPLSQPGPVDSIRTFTTRAVHTVGTQSMHTSPPKGGLSGVAG